MMRSVSSIVLAAALGMSGCTSVAETADDGSCPGLLNDAAIRDDPTHPQYRAMVACQVAALTEAVSGRLPDAPERCRIMEAVVERLDLSSFGSSLGPRIDGDTRLAEVATPSLSADCLVVSFGEPDWERTLTLEAVGDGVAVLRLADQAQDATYDAPAALLMPLTDAPRLSAEEWCTAAERLPALGPCP